ncbi:MAG: hypothetical protein ABH815_05195 [Candidatus Omnitrophota bacterium]
MKKSILAIILVIVALILYLEQKMISPPAKYPIQINNFTMSRDEFGDYFRETNIYGDDNIEARKKVLDSLIDRKLILQEAEKKGLNKDRGFLKALERQYEYLLFKLAIDKKSKELGQTIDISDDEVERYYNKLVRQGLTEKPLDEIYSQVKWQAFREKQTQAMEDWLKELRDNSTMKIDGPSILNDK